MNFKTRQKLVSYQQKKLRQQLRFLNMKSTYYANTKALLGMPIIDKKVMIDNFNEMNTVGIDFDEAMNIAMKAERTRDFSETYNGISVGLSSGTTGNRSLFISSDDEQAMWTGCILARALPSSIFKKHKIAFFMRANNNLYDSAKSSSIQIHFFDLFVDPDQNIRVLMEEDYDILIAQPSMLLLILNYCIENSIKKTFKKIISIAELLEEKDKLTLESFFNIKIDQIYQATEGFLGYTCSHNQIHLNECNMVIEKEYIDDSRYYPIITDYTRKSQPIIRYKLNDILMEGSFCPCGDVSSVVTHIEGRSDDIFMFHTLEQKVKYVFPDFIRNSVIKASSHVKEYQVIQQHNMDIEVYLIFGAEVDFEMEYLKIRIELLRLIEDCLPVKITFFTGLTHDRGTKLRRIISYAKK